jgi:hypothetical protein
MDLGRLLLWAAVIVSAPRWAGAMLAADVNHIQDWLSAFLNGANTLSGLGMGILEVVATAYLLDALRKERPTITRFRTILSTKNTKDHEGKEIKEKKEIVRANWRFYGILGFVIGLLGITPVVLAPYLVSRMTGQNIEAVLRTLAWQYAWAVTVAVAPVFVVGGVAFAQSGLVSLASTSPPAPLLRKDTAGEGGQVAMRVEEVAGSRGKYRSWKGVPAVERLKVARMSVQEVMGVYGVPERTAYDWMKYARRDHGVVGEVAMFEEEVRTADLADFADDPVKNTQDRR